MPFGHLDADCFYVSAERVRNQFLQGKPVGVLGNQGACVIAKSYEMKAAGVKTGTPIWEAVKLCPDGLYIKRDFRWFSTYYSPDPEEPATPPCGGPPSARNAPRPGYVNPRQWERRLDRTLVSRRLPRPPAWEYEPGSRTASSLVTPPRRRPRPLRGRAVPV